MSSLKNIPWLWPLTILILANSFILLAAPPVLRYLAAVVLLAWLPGWVWLQAFFERPGDPVERITLAVGISLAAKVSLAMLVVYLPGAISASKILLLTDAVIISGIGLTAWRRRGVSPAGLNVASRWWLTLLLLIVLAAALRWPRLGYAEFHEDEAEALMLGVRLLQGEDYALFLHRKGPAQMLLPLAFWLLTGQITEGLARFPFMLSSLLSVVTLFFIGRRWFDTRVGVIAALLWAINGYAIGFGRMVQYQALIFFLGPLAIYCLYLAWRYRQSLWASVAALLLATCLLAHFDALLLLPAAGYTAWLAIRERKLNPPNTSEYPPSPNLPISQPPNLIPHLILALTLFASLLAAFYIPYFLDPEFSNTAAYLAESRVRPGLIYNNLDLLRRLDADYSSRFYMPLVGVGLIAFLIEQSRHLTLRWRWGLLVAGVLALSTWWWPDLWRVGTSSLAIIPWLALILLGLWRFPDPPVKIIWLMFGAGFIGYVFLVDDPRTHVYIMYPGAVLVAGVGWGGLIRRLEDWEIGRLNNFQFPISNLQSLTSHLPYWLTLIVAGLLILSITLYDATIFLRSESALTDVRNGWDNSFWERLYDDLPDERVYFGYPKREGWKAIGALRAQGHFLGDFRSVNEDFIVPIWYNYGQARSCYDAPAHFFVRTTDLESPFNPSGYYDAARIEREQVVRLRIFTDDALANGPPTTYRLEDLSAAFDDLATPQQFAQQNRPAQLVGTQFGPAIQFVGYDLPKNVVAPGETLHLNLYWLALAAPQIDYRAFIHLTDGATLWAQQDDQPACRLPTSIWRVGQRGVGQFRLAIPTEMPPGRYPLIIGLYRADTLERLKIEAGAGQVGDDFLWLGDIEVDQGNR